VGSPGRFAFTEGEPSIMDIQEYSFGRIRIDGTTYEHDVVIDRGKVSKRKKNHSKEFRERFGHTPLSLKEKIPWKCSRLVVGTGANGSLPVMDDVQREADDRNIKLIVLPTSEAVGVLNKESRRTNAILHVTC
jgi:hypothetical protein